MANSHKHESFHKFVSKNEPSYLIWGNTIDIIELNNAKMNYRNPYSLQKG